MSSVRRILDSEGVIDREKVVRVLEETGFAYTLSCESGSNNADFAEFASTQALAYFKSALQKPALTHAELCMLLRRAASREAQRQCRTPWHVFMANYIQKHCNENNMLSY